MQMQLLLEGSSEQPIFPDFGIQWGLDKKYIQNNGAETT
jgi:hypothetical protein